MKPIVTIRPEPGAAGTVALGAEMGLDIVGQPLFRVEPVAWDVPDPARFDAVLIGSANALRHGGAGLAELTGMPAYCVGKATAAAAREAGFAVAAMGKGGLQSVLPQAALGGHTRLLRLSGEAHVPLAEPEATGIATAVLYRVVADPIDPDLAARLREGALVVLHSGEAAMHFAHEIDRLTIPRTSVALACLAPRIAARAGGGWRALASAPEPEDRALLALAAQMCQASPP